MDLRALPAFSISKACDHGLTRTQVELAVKCGVLVPLGCGVVAGIARLSDPVDAHVQNIRAALLRTRGLAVASHGSAALVHGLARLGRPSGRVRLTSGTSRYRRLDLDATLHVAGLPPEHVCRRRGIEVTTAARTVVDLSRRISFRGGVVLADSAMRAGVTRSEMSAVLDFCRRWPGRRGARQVVAFASPLAESPLESVSRVVFARALPDSELQADIRIAGRFIARVDFRWGRVIGEADGMSKYDDPMALRREKLRQMALEDAGFEVVRWTWDEIWRTPELVLGRLARAFRRTSQPLPSTLLGFCADRWPG